METEKKLWFKGKKYGFGWTPATWQGKLLTLIYVIGLAHFAIQAYDRSSIESTLLHFALDFVILTGFYLAVCYYTGEKLKWRWGETKTEVAPATPAPAPSPAAAPAKTEDNATPKAQP